MVQQQVDHPGQGGRRRLVTGEYEGDEVVANLLVGQLIPILGACVDEHPQNPGVTTRIGATGGDHRHQQLVDTPVQSVEPTPEPQGAEPSCGIARRGLLGDRQHQKFVERLPDPGDVGPVANPEHDPHDHVETQFAGRLQQPHRLRDRPPSHRGTGGLFDDGDVAAEGVAE
jgi:hypothetical protein